MGADLIGRDEALRLALDGFAELPAGVVVVGEAGIGKTSVWRAAMRGLAARGLRVLSTRPAEAESRLSYAGLADVLDPVLEEALAELPPPQRDALEVAVHRARPVGGPPEQAAIAFAALGALRTSARSAPTVVAVDDAQWLDASSSFALSFVAARLRDEGVGFLLALRSGPSEEARLQAERALGEERVLRVRLGPLSLGALHQLVQSRLGIVFSRPTLERVHETSGGNPFFALELARALQEHGERLQPGEPLPVSGELRKLLRARLAALPNDSGQALRVAAAAEQPTVELVAQALAKDALPSLRRAVDADLIELDRDRIRFVHPLFASAVSAETGAEDNRAVHRRLAVVVDDVEQRARHLARGAEAPDAQVASALDAGARAARGRGAPQAAAELSEQALRLTPQGHVEAAHLRRLDAGAAYFEAGDSARARALFAEAADSADPGCLRAEALSRLGRVHHYAGDQRVAVELFRECLAAPRADPATRADAEDGLASSLFFLRAELADALLHARSAVRIAEEMGDQGALAVALGTQGAIEAVLGHRGAMETLQSAVKLEKRASGSPLARQPSFQLGFVRVWGDDAVAARAVLEDVRRRAVAQGDEGSLPFVLTYLSLAELLSGRWGEAMRTAVEGERVALAAGQETGRAFALSARALTAACLGHEAVARSDADEALRLAERGAMLATMTSLWALGLLDLSLNRPAEAHRRLGPLLERVEAAGIAEPGSIRFVTDDVEALVELGDLDAAAARLDRFQDQARRLGRRSAIAAAERCRGLLAAGAGAGDEALAALHRALDQVEPLGVPFERARTLLALGAAQRRGNQRRAARASLEDARAAFDDLGASLWSRRTRVELARISGRAPSRGELTASERRVAELVAEGRTNREVAAALYVSPRTVEGALSRVYAKLGVRSRTELARRLGAPLN